MGTTILAERKVDNWQEVLWREWRYCGDRDYAKHLRRILLTEPLSWIHSVSFKGNPRPYAAEVEAALRTACQVHGGIRHLWKERLARLDIAKKKSTSLQKLIIKLQDHYWLERFISRHVLLYRGGEAVEPLLELAQMDSPNVRPIALWLLESISEETRNRLKEKAKNLFCSRCIVHCHRLEVYLPEQGRITYYGCPLCRQSRNFQVWAGGVVAVLDKTSRKEKIQTDDQIRVNWLRRRVLFDFEWVEIIRASDEDVERFAVQVGNDTDQSRRFRYKEMHCKISPDCKLSENTLRILEHIFGCVETEESFNI